MDSLFVNTSHVGCYCPVGNISALLSFCEHPRSRLEIFNFRDLKAGFFNTLSR